MIVNLSMFPLLRKCFNGPIVQVFNISLTPQTDLCFNVSMLQYLNVSVRFGSTSCAARHDSKTDPESFAIEFGNGAEPKAMQRVVG